MIPLYTRAYDGKPLLPACDGELRVAKLYAQEFSGGTFYGLRRAPLAWRHNPDHDLVQNRLPLVNVIPLDGIMVPR